jgi:hypothetical protein
LKQQISFIGQKWPKETLCGHWPPRNLGMPPSAALLRTLSTSKRLKFFVNCQASRFGLNWVCGKNNYSSVSFLVCRRLRIQPGNTRQSFFRQRIFFASATIGRHACRMDFI